MTRSKFAIISAVLAILVVVFFAFDFISLFGYGATGFDMLEDIVENFEMPYGALLISVTCAGLAAILSLVSIKARPAALGAAIAALLTPVCMFISLKDSMDYITTGVYLVAIAAVASLICSLLAFKSKE